MQEPGLASGEMIDLTRRHAAKILAYFTSDDNVTNKSKAGLLASISVQKWANNCLLSRYPEKARF